jgi:hypothetical protein
MKKKKWRTHLEGSTSITRRGSAAGFERQIHHFFAILPIWPGKAGKCALKK